MMATNKKFPPLPATFEAPAGIVRVILAGDLTDESGAAASGLWQANKRLISVDPCDGDEQRWRIFFHEATHVALDDGGLSQTMSSEMQEAVCVAVSTARFRERFG